MVSLPEEQEIITRALDESYGQVQTTQVRAVVSFNESVESAPTIESNPT
jgi:hypothetical protein